MTNIFAAIITTLVVTNNLQVGINPGNTEMWIQPVVTTMDIYSRTNGIQVTNIVSVVSNEPIRMVWQPAPLIRQPLTLNDNTNRVPTNDLPPMPPGMTNR